MSVFLQNPALLWLLALAGVPLLVHLLARTKPPSQPFPNIEFLKKVVHLTARFRKPKDWWLLALRSLALLALAAAFLAPLLFSKNAALPGERKTLVLLIDRSGSMAAREGAGTRFEAATAAASGILDEARPDLSNIVWIDARPSAEFPQPAANRTALTEALTQASVRPEANSVRAGFELALKQFSEASGHRELHLISDFQASAWQDMDLTPPDGVDLYFHPVATTTVPNTAVASLTASPSDPVAGRSMLVQCRVVNYSDEARRVNLTLDAGGSPQSRPLDLPPGGEAEAAFTVRCDAAGLMPLTAAIDSDAFPLDDQRHSVIRVRDSLRLVVLAGDSDPATQSLGRLASALPWLELIAASSPPPPCDLLLIPEWDGSNPDELVTLAETGTSIMVMPGKQVTTGAIATLFDSTAAPGRMLFEENDEGWLALPEESHPAFALFADGGFGNPLAGRFTRRLKLPELAPTRIIARFDDKVPALIESSDPKRRILVSNLSLNPAYGNWTLQSTFLPAFAELILHHAPQQSGNSFTAISGLPLIWITLDPTSTDTPTLESPDGSTLKAGNQPDDPGIWRSTEPATPGIHRWLVSGQPVHLQAVNFPAAESDLVPMTTAPETSNSASTAPTLAALNQGMPLWPLLLLVALLCFLAEGFIASIQPKRKERAK